MIKTERNSCKSKKLMAWKVATKTRMIVKEKFFFFSFSLVETKKENELVKIKQ